MSNPEKNTTTLPHHSVLHREGPGFAVTVLPASPYEVNYVPAHHVIGFTFEGQRGVDAFGGSRRRVFDAEPWRLAFTPAGCDVFSASEKGGEYLVLSVAPETFARHAPGTVRGRLPQITNVADPLFTPLAIGLRRAAMLGAAAPLAIETLVAAAVERISAVHDTARGFAGAADRTSAPANRGCLPPQCPGKSRGRCRCDRILESCPHDDGLPPRAWYNSQRMDANGRRHTTGAIAKLPKGNAQV